MMRLKGHKSHLTLSIGSATRTSNKMKIDTPEISWHSRQPMYSLDIQPGKSEVKRLATGSTDANVRVSLIQTDKKNMAVEFRRLKLKQGISDFHPIAN